MARQSLGDLLGNLDDTRRPGVVPAEVEEPKPAATVQPLEAAITLPKTRGARPAPPPARREVEVLPNYLRLVRKETRLREDQQNQLTVHARRLNRAKVAGTPRITDNTLIRVAVDLLLTVVPQAEGNDEAELLRNVLR